MKAYILAVAGAVLFSAVVAMIAPSGKMGKFIRGASKLLILVALLAPVAALVQERSFSLSEGDPVPTDASYLEAQAKIASQREGEEISAFLAEEYGISARAEVEYDAQTFSRKKVAVKISDFGIIGQDEHIDTMGKIERELEAKYGCEAEVCVEGTA